MQQGPPCLPRVDLPVQGTLTLDVYSDLHVGSRGFLRDRFTRDLQDNLLDPARYLILNGDLFNAEMKDAKHGGIFEEVMPLDDAIDWLEKALAPVAHKILAITGGNHDARAWDRVGMDPVKQLAARLRVADRYMKDGGYLHTRHGEAANTHDRHGAPRPIEYVGYLNHGTGGGPTSTSANRITSAYRADWYALGHTHSPLVTSGILYDYYPQTQTVVPRPWKLGVGGSYLAYGGYALERRYVPRPNGRMSIRLADGRKQVEISTP